MNALSVHYMKLVQQILVHVYSVLHIRFLQVITSGYLEYY
jgi:hypothetical protein